MCKTIEGDGVNVEIYLIESLGGKSIRSPVAKITNNLV